MASSRSSSRATRMPEIEVSGTSAKHAAAVVDHDQDAQATAVDELVGNEVERPALVRQLRHQHRCARAQSPLASAAPAHRETFLAIEPKQPLVVHRKALPPQQHMQAPVAKAAALMGQSP